MNLPFFIKTDECVGLLAFADFFWKSSVCSTGFSLLQAPPLLACQTSYAVWFMEALCNRERFLTRKDTFCS
jgi:hypothetical protein